MAIAIKFVLFAATLAIANAGFLPSDVIQYSSAPDVSTSYFNQALPAQVAIAHPQPASIAYQAPVTAQLSTGYLPNIRQSVPISTQLSLGYLPTQGQSHQSVIRSPLGGSISQYSKSLDSAYSSVRKFDTRITNDLHLHPVSSIVQRYAQAQPIGSSPLIQLYNQPIVSAIQTAPIVQRLAHPVAHGSLVSGPIVQRYAQPFAQTLSHGPSLQTPVATLVRGSGPVVSHVRYTSPITSYAW
ncbi:unnamed protein product [Brassicogethes aeneus]|uniref:Uncharacterized protein n=1 Tax=Brassicogethes aeneus TaxID=1431903 RepID=A0A9P0FFZ1_BRAAE|nr:unnamed protein product [Brassicogethes aeneus]